MFMIECNMPIRECRFPRQKKDSSELQGRWVLRDYEIFGASGWREKFVSELAKMQNVEIHLHPHFFPQNLSDIYGEELAKWEAALGSRVFKKKETILTESVFVELFESIFPETQRLLGDLRPRILRSYLMQMEITSLNFHDIFRYFPFFLKKDLSIDRPISQQSWQVARWEWLLCELEYMETSSHSKFSDIQIEQDISYQINPALFVVNQEQPIQALGIANGVFAIFVEPGTMLIRTHQLQLPEARILELLESEMTLTEFQMLQILAGNNDLFSRTSQSPLQGHSLEVSKEECQWRSCLRQMEKQGLIERIH